jgi:hypothetical protein
MVVAGQKRDVGAARAGAGLSSSSQSSIDTCSSINKR